MGKTRKPPRTIRLVRPSDETGPGVFCLTQRQKTTFYVFKEITCDIGGRGFAVHRLGLSDLYHVRVGRPHECTCECLGFLAHGNCKHILGLKTLVENGLIETSEVLKTSEV